MIYCIALELYFLEVSLLMHSFINFGQRSCPVLAGHNLWHMFASYVTLSIHTILYYAYYCITIPGRTANTNTTIFLLWHTQQKVKKGRKGIFMTKATVVNVTYPYINLTSYIYIYIYTRFPHGCSWYGIIPAFFNFLITYLFSIKFLYYFISFTLM